MDVCGKFFRQQHLNGGKRNEYEDKNAGVFCSGYRFVP